MLYNAYTFNLKHKLIDIPLRNWNIESDIVLLVFK